MRYNGNKLFEARVGDQKVDVKKVVDGD